MELFKKGTWKPHYGPYLISIAVILTWAIYMSLSSEWKLFADNWFMSVTMAFGSFIAGATSEGGGAVAFPVMTLLFDISPSTARDFSLMIQSIGMTAAASTILFMKIPVEKRAIIFGSIGGAIGIIFSLELISPIIPPVYAKIFFTSFWLSFAFALYWINREHGRILKKEIVNFNTKHALFLLVVGFFGGAIGGITGSGLDILTFAIITLAFRIDESIATPTSVVLMGVNALVGFLWKLSFSSIELAPIAWDYWLVCVPIVVLGAPFGAWFIKHRSRKFIVRFLYLSLIVQYVAALIILLYTASLIAFNIIVLSGGAMIFALVSYFGKLHLNVLTGKDNPVN